MSVWSRLRFVNDKSTSSFTILACERCGTFREPPTFDLDGIDRPLGPLRCSECSGVLSLFECNLHPANETWQERPGAAWLHIATFSSIADVAHHIRVDEHRPPREDA